ncbi:MAG: hypothetical protein ACUVRQ_08935 [Thermoanaerobaculaceae bacterium]
MRWVLVFLLLFGAACKAPPQKSPGPATPTSTPHSQAGTLVLRGEDMEAYLAVKRKALSRLEQALDLLERQGGNPIQELREMATYETEAAKALGFDPAYIAGVREAVAALVALKGREEDLFRVEQELNRSREELRRQRELTKDLAARQFIDAQIQALDRELTKMASERERFSAKDSEKELLSRFRVELAQLQAREERVTRRLREVWTESQRPRSPRRPSVP